MGILPLTTGRLTVRMMREPDAEAFATYRNDPAVATYQDWHLPYTIEDAHRLIATQRHVDDVTAGTWVQLALDHHGVMVGDVAVGLDDAGQEATIGYTLATEHQHHGYAREAVGAVVDALFERHGARRIVAGLDPTNHASMRVVESLGFRSEGISRSVIDVRGQWMDDHRFGLLADERAAWVERPRTPFDVVELVPLDHANLDAVLRLRTHVHQEPLVAPVARSLAQALVPPLYQGHHPTPWYRAVVGDGEVVGFLMLSAVSDWEPEPYLWRFLIDRAHQQRGVGRVAIERLAELMRADGHAGLRVSWVDALGGPRRFYEGLGFVATGVTDEGEVEGRLAL